MTKLARLAIDFGTSHTVAVLDPGTGLGQALLFGDSPLLPSAVYATEPGQLLVGRDAIRAAKTAPECFEPNPKRRIDDGTVLLGSQEYPVATLISEVLKAVAAEARRVAGGPLGEVAVTHPAIWGKQRLDVLRQAAREAWLGDVTLVPEPEAAAVYFTKSEDTGALAETVVVYDFGGGTFDVCVLVRVDGRYQVRAQAGLDDVGGADLDAALLAHMGQTASAVDASTWQRILQPDGPATRRAFRTLYEDIKAAKEQLSRNASGLVHIPMLDRDFPVTRDEFEHVARPLIEQTVKLTADMVSAAGITEGQPLGLYLVGGSSRVPLVSTLLHRKLRRAPVITGQPEQVVAQGALLRMGDPKSSDAPQALPIVTKTSLTSPPQSGPPAAVVPVSPPPARQAPPQRQSSPPRQHPQVRPAPPARQTPPRQAAAPARPAPPPQRQVPQQRQAPPPPAPRKSRKGRYLLLAVVLLLALVTGVYVFYEYGLNEGGGPMDSADDGSDVNVSEELAPESYSECARPDGSGDGILVQISCTDENAVYGVTRSVQAEEECDEATEEYTGHFKDSEEVLCMTGLFVPTSCLDGSFNTDSCEDPENVPYVIREGPFEQDQCEGEFEGTVKLSDSEQFYCYDLNATT
ncbi:Hsp70 family protein [Stackebrandtia nassauensis]|uniref:Heat shock protein 70 n=1 Tax=Stackebrandtia nassauensis (strain DSM 44728 / CIP 108903 / NRRL B-16338 / NBRC 102104 / LLR-40K-21) TaxID=446470 RepID=D3PWJ0_STANL|nr:Hsp70 family protein [Stackebrandtia nassauensis]ADD43212.1 Heat shock protein 70 [Stackebrandtia nassauensis DSM 44728]